MTDAFFPYEIADRARVPLKVFGVGAEDGVTVTDDTFRAAFGRLKLETRRDNVPGAHITTGYRWWTSIGARLSFVDDGLTFGTNTRAGVCVHFAERVPKVIGFKAHSALTVTVADCDALVELLGLDEPPAD